MAAPMGDLVAGRAIVTGAGSGIGRASALTPAARRGTAEEMAACVAFLASVEAAYVNGHLLVADGGWTAR